MTQTHDAVREHLRIRRGDIYWAPPDEARGGPFSHPHVIVQDDVFNQSRISTVVACALTTNLNRANEPGNVLLEEGEGGLPKRSVVIVSQISSVEKLALGERIGALSAERVEQILDGLRFQQRAFFRDDPGE
jgi:mRNA interferase MazF